MARDNTHITGVNTCLEPDVLRLTSIIASWGCIAVIVRTWRRLLADENASDPGFFSKGRGLIQQYNTHDCASHLRKD